MELHCHQEPLLLTEINLTSLRVSGAFYEIYFQWYSISTEMSFCSHINSNRMIATIYFLIRHGICAAVAAAIWWPRNELQYKRCSIEFQLRWKIVSDMGARTWISNYIHVKHHGAITHPLLKFNSGLNKSSLMFAHGWLHRKWIYGC